MCPRLLGPGTGICVAALAKGILALDKHTAYFNILGALPQAGCAICRLAHTVELHYIRDVLYSRTTDVKTRAELRSARGFCRPHAQQLDAIGHALDVSIIYQDILMTLKEALEQPSSRQVASRRGRAQLVDALSVQRECPACIHRAELEAVYVETFLDHMADPEFVDRVRNADPLCLTHLLQAIEQGPSSERFQVLRDIQLAHWEQLIAELGEFVRKNDHRFHNEVIGKEGDAWIRAIDAIFGTLRF